MPEIYQSLTSSSTVNTVAEEFKKMEVEEISAAQPSGEALEMETTEPSTSLVPSTVTITESKKEFVPKQTILIKPGKDDPNRIFKRKKGVVNNPPPPNSPTSFENRQLRTQRTIHNFHKRRRFSQDLRIFRGLGETFLHLLNQSAAPPPSRGWKNRGRGRGGKHC